MSKVPAPEGIVDRLGELLEGVGATGHERPPGPRPEVAALADTHQLDVDDQPAARHRRGR